MGDEIKKRHKMVCFEKHFSKYLKIGVGYACAGHSRLKLRSLFDFIWL